MHADYTGQGFDQLDDVIDKIKKRPDDRRIILSAWNPSDLKLMALPPCHIFAQVLDIVVSLSCVCPCFNTLVKHYFLVEELSLALFINCSSLWPMGSYPVKCISALLMWVLKSHLILHCMLC